MDLPQDLRRAIDKELQPLSSKQLSTIAQELSKRYREGLGTKGESFLKSSKDVTAYASFRMPATYAAVVAALKQVKAVHGDWTPKSLMDVGAGPGTATWAATTIWPEIAEITLLEREGDMIALGKRLAAEADEIPVRGANWIKTDITGEWEGRQTDLIIASYSLGELSPEKLKRILYKLWALTSGLLVIIEPGTPAGFGRIKEAREALIKEGAKTVAPCPHDDACPLQADDWCHFSQRITRSRLHRQVKGGELSYEDEKFTFIAIARETTPSIQGRVLRHPIIRKGHIQLQLCTKEGLRGTVITRRDKEAYRRAKDLEWGSDI